MVFDLENLCTKMEERMVKNVYNDIFDNSKRRRWIMDRFYLLSPSPILFSVLKSTHQDASFEIYKSQIKKIKTLAIFSNYAYSKIKFFSLFDPGLVDL